MMPRLIGSFDLVREKVKTIIELLKDDERLEREREAERKLRENLGSKSSCKGVAELKLS